MTEKEIFKDIPGYEGYYQASNMGNVRSVDRTAVDSMGRKRFFKGRVIIGSINNDGYRKIRLFVNGKSKIFNASQLVAMAFLHHKPDGHTLVVDHVNGVKTDDRLINLRIVTHRENTSDNCFRKDRKTLISKHTGVCWHKKSNKWVSYIYIGRKQKHLGSFNTELEAHEAYQKALAKIETKVRTSV